ncbi:DUF4347 domain-containing protein [Pseudomonas sp. ABC1]|uniref:DUF4347 domain-containing protein n=1 Tax=Pseudomonas sp. ABC1 TaxID=2748080 RepID=UPI0015C36E5D|nr:DUF4347 domain-containing protein [Pseudomonas sp. ABC1]QLF92922.1 DUF4347 domain-containing protein [Pseudomonas sp. ABC1]
MKFIERFSRKPAQPPRLVEPGPAPLLVALEPRIMFDASVAVVAEDAAAQTAADTARDSASSTADAASADARSPQNQRQEVVFVDGGVANVGELLAGLPGSAEVVILDPSKDGLQQMAEYLKGREGLDAIHLLSHGADGTVLVGNIWLSSANLVEHRAALESIGAALNADGDLLLYGCSVGADTAGIDFISSLAAATGADVAASDDITGKGGDWNLEVNTGEIEASVLQIDTYQHALNVSNTTAELLIDGAPALSATVGAGVEFLMDGRADVSESNWYIDIDPSASTITMTFVTNDVSVREGIARLDVVFSNGTLDAITSITADTDATTSPADISASVVGDDKTISFHIDTAGTGGDGVLVWRFTSTSTAADTAPSVSASGTNPNYLENSSPVALFSNVTASTNDSDQSFTGATFTVTNVSNGALEVLSIDGINIGLSNGNSGVLASGGSYSVSVVAGTATVTLSGMSRTDAQMNTLINNITYGNGSDDPGNSSRVVTITEITDSGSNNTAALNIVSTVSVIPVNDAPVITPVNPTLAGLSDSSTNNNGDAVNTLLGGVTDVDTGSLKGMIVTGITSTYGTWQYSTNNGFSWTDIGSASDASGLLLRSTDRVRFVPDGVHGETATITYRAWDQTNSTQGGQGSRLNVTSLLGGSNAFSTGTDTASVVVTAINDAPIVTGSGGSVGWTEGNNVTSTPVTVDANIYLSDPDGPGVDYVRVQVTSNYASGEDVLGFNNTDMAVYGDIAGAWNAGLGILTLTSSSGTATQAQFQAAMRAVTFTNTSDAPIVATRTVTFQANDGSLNSNVVSRSVTITAVDDSPVISAPTNVTVTEDTLSPVTGIILSDVDSASGSLTLTVGAGNLSATSGSGVTVSGTGTALILNGTLTAINNFIAAGSLKYTPALNSNTSVTLGLSLDTASVSTDTRNLTIDITPVNDAPTISGPVSINVTEDVAKSMAGITFGDVDSGSGSVRVIFSVANGNGTFSATASSGVTVTNNGTNAITLEGTVADINTLVSNGRLTYLGALNAAGVKTMSISINDNGNTGSGGALQVNANISLVIAAVNDAPVNNLPAAQTVFQDGSLVFNSANGNLITITDVDVGGNTVKLSLTSVNGQMTLGSIVGLSFSTGDGTNDTSMVFTGTLAAINAALNGLTFTPQPGYNGTGSITFVSDDQGYSGAGGVQTDTDTDTLSITIAPINPKITGVVAAPGSDGAHKVGETIDIVVQFDNNVIVDTSSGIPTLLLETGAIDRQAVYLSGTGTNQLTFRYTVQVGDLSGDLDYASTSALSLNGAVLQSAQGHSAILTLPAVGGASSLAGQQAIVVDGVAPSISNIVLPSDASYRLGQNMDFTVNFSEAVSVDATGGTPRIEVTLDTGGVAYAEYVSGSGTSALVFRLVVASGQQDSNGITVGNSIQLNGGSLRDLAGNDSPVALAPGNSSGILVDGIVPTVATVSVPASGSYKSGDVLSFTVNTSEGVVVDTLGGTPRLVLTVGGVTRYASYVSGGADGALVFQYTVQSGDTAASGIVVNGTLDLNGGHVNDPAGNALNLNLGAVGNTGNVLIDTTTPYATNITRVDATPTNSGSVSYTVTFSENVGNVDPSDFNLIFGGSVAGSIESVTAVDGKTFTVKVSGLTGTGTVRLDLKPGTDIADAAGNLVPGGRVGVNYTIDRDAPSVTGVDVPVDGTYIPGQNLDFTVHLSENVQLNTSGGSPRLEVLLDNGQTAWADYVSGAGTSALVFRLTVATGQLDTNGITLGNAIQLNGATLRDSVGNDAQLALNGLSPTDGVLVDGVAPTVASVTLPAPGAYNAGDVLRFTVNASEVVIVDSGTPQLAINIGGVTRYAQYVAGSGTSALVFEYTVDSTVNAPNGISLAASIDSSGATLHDAAGNAMSLTLNNVGSGSAVIVDNNAPNFVSTDNVDVTPTNAGSVRFTVTFNETVTGVDSSDFSLVLTGSANGRIASVTQIDGRTYLVTVDNLSGAGNLRLDLNASGTGITDVAGNPIVGGGEGSGYDIDRVAPSVISVGVPPAGTYVAGSQLDFTVKTSEVVLVDTGTGANGAPRLAITLDNGEVAYATYLSGSQSDTLTFRLNVTNGMSGNTTFNVASSIDVNQGSIRDAQGNDALTSLNNVGSTSGILVDASAPRATSIEVVGPVLPTDRTLTFNLTFNEAVSGVDAADFSVLGTSSASGTVQSVQRIDATTYRIVVGALRGQGTLQLSLNPLNSGIQDGAGNALATSLSSAAQAVQVLDVGDLNYRINPAQTVAEPLPSMVQPQVPTLVADNGVSPLVPGSLFEVRTTGGDIQPLGTIFLGNASSAPSFIAQVFGSSDSSAGLGGGFGSSTLSTIFSHDVPGVSEMNVFNGGQWRPADINHGLRGVFGTPTFGQQLQQINEADQRHVRELAMALAQSAQIGQRT